MKCPKCHTEITRQDQICPGCKKVLKLKCPNCGALSSKSVCEKCGTVLLNKCYKCGKLNLVTNDKCSACGLDINASIGLRESVIEEFAALTIEITNLDEIKEVFNSEKIKEQFRQNLFNLIKKPASQRKLRVQMIDNTFIIRFNKDLSFNESCKSAIDFSLFVAQTITQINKKLTAVKGVAIRAQMAVQSRDIYAKSSEYKSGINISVVYSSLGSAQIFENIETIVDYYVYQEIKNEYPLQSLCAVYLKNQMIMFFELMLSKIFKEKEDRNDREKMKLPESADFVPEEEEDEELIDFVGLHCSFIRSKGENLLSKLAELKEVKNPIVSVKRDRKYDYLSMISDKELEETFSDSRIYRFSCTQNQKYSVYGLLKQMFLSYKNTLEEDVLLEPEKILALTDDSYIRNLLELKVSETVHPEDLKYSYYEAFSMFVRSIPYKSLFVIEDFQNADETSLEIIKYLIENDELGNVGFIVSNEKSFSLHRKIYRLMTRENYIEIEVTPSANKSVLTANLDEIAKIQGSFFLEKALENTKGSYLYFNNALMYLTDENVLEYKKSKYWVKEERMVVIPTDFDELIQKRLFHLRKYKDVFELFGSLLLISEKMPVDFIDKLGYEYTSKVIAYLEKKRFIEILEQKYVKIRNYNIFRENFIKVCDEDILQMISHNLLDKLYVNIDIPNCTKAEILDYAKLKKESFTQWHSLAMISSQIGDFCAYLNNTNKFLSLVDNVIDEDTDRNIEQIRIDVYSELASLLYKYYPDKIISFLEMILANFEEQNDDAKIKEISNKLVQSCIISGNYNNALEYMGKIISRTKRGSFNPADSNFSLNYFLTHLVTLELYFNLGRLNECIELGEELFKYIDLVNLDERILPEGFSVKQFENSLFDALFFINLSRVIQLKSDTRQKLSELQLLPEDYRTCFVLLSLILDFFEGKDIIPVLSNIAQEGLPDKYSEILFPFLQALVSMRYQDWDKFGNYIYEVKIRVSNLNLHQFNYYCDLLIGYAYQNLNNLKKAKQIYYNVLDIASEKGLKNIIYVTWFLIAKLESQSQNNQLVENILNNSILKLENDGNISELYSILLKSFASQALLLANASQNAERALFLAEQAFYGALNNRLIIYLPQSAEILLFLYNKILETPQSKDIILTYQNKIQKVQQTLAQIFSVQEPQ